MKSTGIVRKVDNLGRIVLPVELRRTLGIDIHSDVEIYVDGDQVILKKYLPCCIFCGSKEELATYDDKYVCRSCRTKLGKLEFPNHKRQAKPLPYGGGFLFCGGPAAGAFL